MDYSGGIYYEKYPEEKKKSYRTLINEGSMEDKPYIRQTKKSEETSLPFADQERNISIVV